MNNYRTLNLVELKEVYWVFNRGGVDSIIAFEVSNNLCSIFLILYLYAVLFRINWNRIIGMDPHSTWIHPEPIIPCPNRVCSIALQANIIVTALIMVWSLISAVSSCAKALAIRKKVTMQIGLNKLDGSTPWKRIANDISMSETQLDNIAFFLCAETRQTAVVLKLLKIQPYSIWVSRYLVWAIQSTLSISRRGVVLDASALNLEIEGMGDNLDLALSAKRIRIIASFLILTSPFFVLYYMTRVLIQEFHRYKAKQGVDKYTWSVGAQYALRLKNELPHKFKKRLNKIQPMVEAVKKNKKQNVCARCIFIITQFVITCLLVTCIAASFVSIEEGILNEPLGIVTGAFSACLMLGMQNEKTHEPYEIEKFKSKIQHKFGKDSDEVAMYLKSRIVYVGMELLGIATTPFILICRLLPRLEEIRMAIEMDHPNATEDPSLIYFETHDTFVDETERMAWEYSDDDNRRTPPVSDNCQTPQIMEHHRLAPALPACGLAPLRYSSTNAIP